MTLDPSVCRRVAAGLLLATMLPVTMLPAQGDDAPEGVSALGRIEPERGVLKIAAPLTLPLQNAGVVVSEVHVAPGDDVEAGQLVAVMETAELERSMIAVAEAEHRLAQRRAESARSRADETCVQARVAEREAGRRAELLQKGVAGEEEAEVAAGQAESLAASCAAARTEIYAADAEVAVAQARIERHRVQFGRTQVRAPTAGRVLDVNAWPGEVAGGQGVIELAKVDSMFAVAEVYETDISRVRLGQRAEVRSDALSEPLTGTVERIHGMVEKQDEIGTDPAARKDARIIEVDVRLDDPAAVAGLTYLQVEVLFLP